MNRRMMAAFFCGAALLAACRRTEAPASEIRAEASVVRAVYQKPDGPYVWTEGGQPRNLAEGANTEEICISDDGSTVAYRSDFGLHAVRVEGGEPVLLIDRAYLDALGLESGGFVTVNQFGFGAGSQHLYFNTKIPAGQQYDLYRVDIEGPAPERLFAPGEGGNFTFSPDGEWMTVFHAGEIVLARPDGSATRTAFTYENAPIGTDGPQVVWARDSSGFSILSYGEKSNTKPQPITVWFVPVRGEPERRWSFQGYLTVRLSPDGGRAVYLNRHDGTTDVHYADSSGTDRLYASLGQSVLIMDWAPSSRRFLLVYFQYREDSPEMISVPYVCAPGEDPLRLTDTPTAYPAYWVDDDRVLYSMESAELRLQEVGKPSLLIDDGLLINDFDFTLLPAE
ncbi:MAG: PD40 domain-containing protein [Anaerolineales bacterium]|nr:PD40 domain-containing protein [Anaerolineales bacterium]